MPTTAVLAGGLFDLVSPDQIPGLHSWFDASQIVGKSAGDAISTWSDVKGGHDATQGTGSKQPLYQTEDGLPAVVFDGTDDALSTSAFTAVSQPFSVFAVYRPSRGLEAPDECAVGAGATIGASYLLEALSNSYYGTMIATEYTTFLYGGLKKNEYQSHAATIRSSGISHSYGNGERQNSGNTMGTATPTSLHLGWSGITNPTFSNYLRGAIREVLFYSRELSIQEVTQVCRYLHNKWDVRIPRQIPPLPPGDPGYDGKVGLVTNLRSSTLNSATRLALCEGIKAMGVDWIREGFDWSNRLNPSSGVWDWSYYDDVMTQVATAGLNVLAILTYSAEWENGGADKFRPPADNADFADYCTQVVSRYGRGGDFWAANPSLDDTYAITEYEIWNEPWLYQFWHPAPDPAGYAALARAAAVAVHDVDAAAKVLLVMDWKWITSEAIGDFMLNVLAADATLPDIFDGFAMHAYPGNKTYGAYFEVEQPYQDVGRVQTLRDSLAYLGWDYQWQITEIGWSTADPSVSGVSEADQADRLFQVMRRVSIDWTDFVERVYLYAYDYSSGILTGSTAWNDNLPILNADGSPKLAVSTITTYLT